jgi:hypothetical protein
VLRGIKIEIIPAVSYSGQLENRHSCVIVPGKKPAVLECL